MAWSGLKVSKTEKCGEIRNSGEKQWGPSSFRVGHFCRDKAEESRLDSVGTSNHETSEIRVRVRSSRFFNDQAGEEGDDEAMGTAVDHVHSDMSCMLLLPAAVKCTTTVNRGIYVAYQVHIIPVVLYLVLIILCTGC